MPEEAQRRLQAARPPLKAIQKASCLRLAYFATHPIQYQAPLLRHLAADERLDLQVFFYSDYSLHQHVDPGYGVPIQWDVPLLAGYNHYFLERVYGGRQRARKAWLPARHVTRMLQQGAFDAVWVHGWAHLCSLQAIMAARRLKVPVLLRGESLPRRLCGPGRRTWPARWVRRMVLRSAAACLCIGSANREFYLENGIPAARLHMMPYAVDNAFFQRKASEARPGREALRASLGLAPDRLLILFVGRLSHVKAPDLLLNSLLLLLAGTRAPAAGRQFSLLLAGDGPMRKQLEAAAQKLPAGTVHFLGFRNQTELPALYDLCDVFVLPSRFEPWGLVVNEVMNAGRAVIVSDRTGSAADLVEPGVNGWLHSNNDVASLAACLREALLNPERLQEMGRRSLQRIEAWNFEADRAGLLAALDDARGGY